MNSDRFLRYKGRIYDTVTGKRIDNYLEKELKNLMKKKASRGFLTQKQKQRINIIKRKIQIKSYNSKSFHSQKLEEKEAKAIANKIKSLLNNSGFKLFNHGEHYHKIYTDGAILRNPHGIGGYAAIVDGIEYAECESIAYGNTNNRMELKAVILGLSKLSMNSQAIIYSDCRYIVDGINNWMFAWANRNWIKKSGEREEVLNKDLWMQLYEMRKNIKFIAKWVRGHSGNSLNERADFLARKAIDDFRNKLIVK
jgi:ribonuclease HI